MAKMTSEEGYKIALERIRETEKTGATRLSLRELELTQLPQELWHLTHLKKLILTANNLTSLPSEIGQLTNLTGLSLALNPLITLPEEIGNLAKLVELELMLTKLVSLPDSLWQLRRLISLDISSSELNILPSGIGQLTTLMSLTLVGGKLTTLPVEIEKLANLYLLNVSLNKITELPPEIGKLTKLTELYLSSNQLAKLPAEIGQLINLRKLKLNNNVLAQLPIEIGYLTNLTELDLSENKLSVVPAEIGKLTSLTSLKLSYNLFNSLPIEIGNLTKLNFLSAAYTYIENLPAEIGNLTELITLDIGMNQISTFPVEFWQLTQLISLDISGPNTVIGSGGLLEIIPNEIGQFANLTNLNLSRNHLTTLPSQIGQLTNLVMLDVSYNLLAGLPQEIRQLVSLQKLDLRHNMLKEIPPEVLERVEQPDIILHSYFARGKKTLNEVKLILVGQGSVGKTSLVKRILLDTYDPQQNKTDGIAVTCWQVKNTSATGKQQAEIQVNMWDFGGQEIMHATHQFFLTKRSFYLLVLDTRLTQEENRVEFWLKIIQSFSDNSPVLIVGNKSDQHQLDIDRTGLQKKYPNVAGFLETSATTGDGIEKLKETITEQINKLPHVRDLVIEDWLKVKGLLETRRAETNFITQGDYLGLCKESGVLGENNQLALLGILHDLGVVIHFQDDPRLEALGILNPQWVTNGVYKIINAKSLFENRGVLTLAMLNDILNLPEYPRDKRFFIIDLMKKFELCYDIEHDKTFLVPDLLPKDEPSLDFHGIPGFEYHYPVLPSSVMTRFIVRMNQKIDNTQVWRSGVLLKIGGNRALVKADIEDRTVRIAIDGLEHTRRDALSAIRYQLDEIHASIKGLNPEKFVPVPGAVHAKPLKYEYLLKLERAGKDTLDVEDGDELREVNILQMLNGVESEYQRRQYGNVTNVHIGGDNTGIINVGDHNEIQG